jgi:hypothetical protein
MRTTVIITRSVNYIITKILGLLLTLSYMLIPVSGLYVEYNLRIYNSELIFYVISTVSLVIKREYIDKFDCSNSIK